jgi:drug/metabolite transporter (DMT)-like permease
MADEAITVVQEGEMNSLAGQQRAIASLAMIGASLCWATGSVLTTVLVKSASPLPIVLVQLAASSIFLWTIVLARRVKIPCTRSLGIASALGLLEPGAAYLCSTLGLESISASAASLIFATEPAMVAALAWPILRERMALEAIIALLLSLLGVALTLSGDLGGDASGAMLIIASTALASLYVVCNQRFAVRAPALLRAALQQVVGVAAIGLLALALGEIHQVQGFAVEMVVITGVTGVIQYGLAFWLYLIAVDQLPVTIATLFLALVPIFTVIEGGLLLGETLSSFQWLGAALVVAALGVSVARDRTHAEHTEALRPLQSA